MIRILRSATLCLLVNAVFSQGAACQIQKGVIWEPVVFTKATDEIPKGSIPKEIVGQLRVSGLNVLLEETKMSDVQASLGGTMGHRGDAADSLEWLCYQIPSDGGRSVLWLMSGEMDGWSVGGFQWLKITAATKIDRRCQMLPHATIELPIAVRPGMTEAALQQILGTPTRRYDNRIEYVHDEELQIHKEPYTETNTLFVLLRKGIVWGLEVWKSTIS